MQEELVESLVEDLPDIRDGGPEEFVAPLPKRRRRSPRSEA